MYCLCAAFVKDTQQPPPLSVMSGSCCSDAVARITGATMVVCTVCSALATLCVFQPVCAAAHVSSAERQALSSRRISDNIPSASTFTGARVETVHCWLGCQCHRQVVWGGSAVLLVCTSP